jgi:CCR4-NOT transcription complex subunit 4
MTKSQVKKERKQKAKEAEAKKQETSVVVEEPVQAPIIGRKRKAKKTPTSNPESTSATPDNITEAAKPITAGKEPIEKAEPRPEPKKSKSKDKVTKDLKSSPVEEMEAPQPKSAAETWRSNNTIEQLIKDSEATGIPIKELFSERTSALPVLLAQLHKSGNLDLNIHPLFNLPNLTQRVDMKCTADDYEILNQPIELTDEHRKALLRGEPVRVNADSHMTKYRCLITPRGCILRHLAANEEDRYLELEKKISATMDPFPEYPPTSITEPDMTNRGGGLDALFATPENFNICWTDETSAGLTSASSSDDMTAPESLVASAAPAPPNVLSAMEADSTRSHNWAIANTAELVNATATSVRSFAAATAKHMLGAAGVVMGNMPDLDDVVGMTDEELRAFAVKSQKELESSRKDLDTIDKKLNALVKRNKKLAQQALATSVEG